MSKENSINFLFNDDNKTIELIGKAENMPKLTIVRGDYTFHLQLTSANLNYIPEL